MENKSRQQQVFEWLLENEDVLNGADNSRLYEQFKKSGLTRNRMRSYKSRLKDKIASGEFDPELDTPDFPEEQNPFCLKNKKINLSLVLKIFGFIVLNIIIYKLIRKIFK